MDNASFYSAYPAGHATYQGEFPANSRSNQEVGYQEGERVEEVRAKVFSEEDLTGSRIQMRKWKRVALVGVAATVVGGGLIVGGVLSANPWLIVAGAITAIVGIILICVALKKGKKEAILYNQMRAQLGVSREEQNLSRSSSSAFLPDEPVPTTFVYDFDEDDSRLSLSQAQDFSRRSSFGYSVEDASEQGDPLANSQLTPPGSRRNSSDSS